MKNLLLPAFGALLLAGAGCLDLPDAYTATDLNLAAGDTIRLEQKNFSLLPGGGDGPYWLVKIESLTVGQELSGSWSRYEERETAASVSAREAAENSGVGEQAVEAPDPVYETVSTEGTFSSRALDTATAASLPSFWPVNDEYQGGERNSVLWLSKQQYDELISTRHTHLELDVLGLGVGGLLDAAGSLKGIIENIGGGDIPKVQLADLTEIEAEADWGSYSVKIDGDTKKVQTVEASNRFAHYVILANPDNPLILEVKLELFGINSNLLSSFGVPDELNGYHVTEINNFKSTAPASEGQPAPLDQ